MSAEGKVTIACSAPGCGARALHSPESVHPHGWILEMVLGPEGARSQLLCPDHSPPLDFVSEGES